MILDAFAYTVRQNDLCLPGFSEEFPWILRTVFRSVFFRHVIDVTERCDSLPEENLEVSCQ